QVGRVANRFLHPVREIPKCAGCALDRDCEHGAYAGFAYDDINVFCFEPAKHRLLRFVRGSGIEHEMIFAAPMLYADRWTRRDLVRCESTFDNEAHREMLMQRTDMALALSLDTPSKN